MSDIERIIYEGALSTVGDPTFLALLIFGFFTGCVLVMGLKNDGRFVIVVPAIFLSLAFLPGYWTVLVAIVLGAIIGLILSRLNR